MAGHCINHKCFKYQHLFFGRPEEYVLLGGITIGILIFPFLPRNLIFSGQSMCLFHLLGIERIFEIFGIHGGCPGCGLTRAFWFLLHGRLEEAVTVNWRIVLVAPGLALLYAKFTYNALQVRLLQTFHTHEGSAAAISSCR